MIGDSLMELLDVPYEITRRYVSDNAAVLGEELSARILGWTRSRDLASLTSCSSLVPLNIVSRDVYRCLLQVEAFYSKCKGLTLRNAAKAAIGKFLDAERKCRITNRRLDYYYTHTDRTRPELREWLLRMEAGIERYLGDRQEFFSCIEGLLRVTAGATSSLPRKRAKPHMKISNRVECTPGAVKYLEAWISNKRHRPLKSFKPKLTVSNRVIVVPKNWKTGRTIACEPTGNVPFQLAFDTYVKERLRSLTKGRIDLSKQSRNQRLAIEGSKSGSWATLDLKQASDTVSYNVVQWLVPMKWLEFLNDVRASHYTIEPDVKKGIDGCGLTRYAKFSSMGNGTTFAIETLVFCAACDAVGSKDHSVYGDDIVIRTEYVEDLKRLLRFLGFELNLDKSHQEGPFRESCGANSFNGVDITPFYIRELDSRKAFLSHLVNGLVSISMPGGLVWEYCRSIVKEWHLIRVPVNEDTTSGVHIDIPTSYSKKLLRRETLSARKRREVSKPFCNQLVYRGYSARTSADRVEDSRTLFLWHLQASEKRLQASEMVLSDRTLFLWHLRVLREQRKFDEKGDARMPVESAMVPCDEHKYVSTWKIWYPPVAGISVHLYAWTDYLLDLE
jgi:hypothetical protein